MALTVTDPQPIERAEEILTPKALAFVEELHKRFAGTRSELLAARAAKREEVARTGKLDFLPETKEIRDGDWKMWEVNKADPSEKPGAEVRLHVLFSRQDVKLIKPKKHRRGSDSDEQRLQPGNQNRGD